MMPSERHKKASEYIFGKGWIEQKPGWTKKVQKAMDEIEIVKVKNGFVVMPVAERGVRYNPRETYAFETFDALVSHLKEYFTEKKEVAERYDP